MKLTKLLQNKLILASKSKVRGDILKAHEIDFEVEPSFIDEDIIKDSLKKEGATPEIVSKNLAEIKAQKISQKKPERLVLGADSVIDLNNEIISKPKTRSEALQILKNLNGRQHYLISSVCIVKNGSMIWNYTDKAILTMKNLTNKELITYLEKISDENLFAYNVYQIEGKGKFLFSSIEGDKNTIMGLPVMKIKNFLEIYE